MDKNSEKLSKARGELFRKLNSEHLENIFLKTIILDKNDETILKSFKNTEFDMFLKVRACNLGPKMIQLLKQNMEISSEIEYFIYIDANLEDEHILWLLWHEFAHSCMQYFPLYPLIELQRKQLCLNEQVEIYSKEYYEECAINDVFHDLDCEEIFANSIANIMVGKSYERKNVDYTSSV